MKELSNQLLDVLNGAGLVETQSHHEFTSGLHGRKADMDILNHNHSLYSRTMDTTASKIRQVFRRGALPEVLVSVTSGTDGWVSDIAHRLTVFAEPLQGPIEAVKTIRDPRDRRSIILGSQAIALFMSGSNNTLREPVASALVIDDIGTQGTNAGMVVDYIREVSPLTEIRVLYIIQRSFALPELSRRNVVVDAVMNLSIPSYTPEKCKQVGDCANGLPLVAYKYATSSVTSS